MNGRSSRPDRARLAAGHATIVARRVRQLLPSRTRADALYQSPVRRLQLLHRLDRALQRLVSHVGGPGALPPSVVPRVRFVPSAIATTAATARTAALSTSSVASTVLASTDSTVHAVGATT